MKWPNDVQVDGRKVAGVLVEGRPHEGWAVVGIGVNVSAAPPDVPDAGTLGREDPEAVLAELLAALEQRLAQPRRRSWRRSAPATRCSASPSAGRAVRASPTASTPTAGCA